MHKLLPLDGYPENWIWRSIGDLLVNVDDPIEMHDEADYRLLSIRRRNEGFFEREVLKGKQILTKTLRKVVPGSFVISRMQVVHGACAFYGREQFDGHVSNSYTQYVSRDPSQLDTEYFGWLAKLPFMYDYFLTSSHGVHIEKMTFQESKWKKFFVPLPPIDQQRRIVEVLTNIDVTIAETEAIIAKTHQVKSGLMQDLFTRGVTTNNKLRPPREEAPHLYKEAWLGWIPKEWDCVKLELLLAPVAYPMRSGPFGSALLKEELVDTGIPLLGIDNVHTEDFVTEYRRFVTPRKFAKLSRYSVIPGDVIITIMGTIGRSCVVPEDVGRALSSKHLWTMTLDRSRVLPELVCWQLNHAPWVKDWLARQSQGAVMDAIQSSTLRAQRLIVPPIGEQLRIRERYFAVQRKLREERDVLRKLRMTKSGLMFDLMTGRVSLSRQISPRSEADPMSV